jgi:hypothetical protein
MRLRLRLRSGPSLPPIALLGLVAGVVLAGCGPRGTPASFDPSSPCTTDGRFAGAYPALEARVPRAYEGKPAGQLDSGRNCSPGQLGTLAGHGITSIRFAGGIWPLGKQAAVTLAVFEGDGLTAASLGEWYEASARAARHTQNIQPTRPTIAGRPGYRLDTTNDESQQTVITWPSASGDAVYVVLAADVPESYVGDAVAAFP